MHLAACVVVVVWACVVSSVGPAVMVMKSCHMCEGLVIVPYCCHCCFFGIVFIFWARACVHLSVGVCLCFSLCAVCDCVFAVSACVCVCLCVDVSLKQE